MMNTAIRFRITFNSLVDILELNQKDLMDIFSVDRTTIWRWKQGSLSNYASASDSVLLVLYMLCRIPEWARAQVIWELKKVRYYDFNNSLDRDLY